mgnify:CR=1 FL=1
MIIDNFQIFILYFNYQLSIYEVYNIKSRQAEEFINHQEILDTLEYAQANRNNRPFIESLIDKAALCQGLSHREAALLLECDEPELVQRIYHLAREIKRKFYGNRIVMFAPLYLSNYCVNGCVYCPYHAKNRTIPRKKLSQEEIRREVIALQDMGHKRLALEAGEDPRNNPIDYILESIRTIYSIHHKNGAIRVNVNIAATTVENYRLLKEAGIGTYILFQETYSKEHYEALHPTGPKSNYAYHTEAMDRAMEGGIDDVGIGVLFGLVKSILSATYTKGIWFAGTGTVLTVLALLLCVGYNHTAYYPSTADLQSSLTLANSCSSKFTLTTMAYVSILVPFVLAYIVYAWRAIDSKPITVDEMKEDDHAY